ncbi:MAG TPA: hypothetical protein VH352_00335 [Pseudonocardiaceae bacterium]|nr:hypothetical protein [Pseudonocardiaceae bacterium]
MLTEVPHDRCRVVPDEPPVELGATGEQPLRPVERTGTGLLEILAEELLGDPGKDHHDSTDDSVRQQMLQSLAHKCIIDPYSDPVNTTTDVIQVTESGQRTY